MIYDPENQRRRKMDDLPRIDMRTEEFKARQAEVVVARRKRQERAAYLLKEADQARTEILAKKKHAIAIAQVMKPTTYERIERRALMVFDLRRNELQSIRRSTKVSFARQFVMYWAARLTALSWGQIGQRMGGADHSTIFYGSRSYANKRNAMGRGLRAARPLSQKKQEVEA